MQAAGSKRLGKWAGRTEQMCLTAQRIDRSRPHTVGQRPCIGSGRCVIAGRHRRRSVVRVSMWREKQHKHAFRMILPGTGPSHRYSGPHPSSSPARGVPCLVHTPMLADQIDQRPRQPCRQPPSQIQRVENDVPGAATIRPLKPLERLIRKSLPGKLRFHQLPVLIDSPAIPNRLISACGDFALAGLLPDCWQVQMIAEDVALRRGKPVIERRRHGAAILNVGDDFMRTDQVGFLAVDR